MEVEVREEASIGHHQSAADATSLLVNNTPVYPVADGPVVIVRVEEVLLVVLVLIIWVAAIALFFNRWGKIRMLEPYQPKFHQQPHRPSCPLAPLSPPVISSQQRMSFSKYNVNALTDPLSALPSPIIRRPRQNSVFVGSSTMAILNPPPRRVKSAMDIQHLIVNDHSPTTSITGSIIPIINRRSSTAIDRPHSRRRPSIITLDRPPPISHISTHKTVRRSSCFVERASSGPPATACRPHRNFISFELSTSSKSSSIPDRPSCSYHQPTISFEAAPNAETTMVTVEVPKLPKMSRSFEQPSTNQRKSKPERMANSLDVSSFNFDSTRRCSIQEEQDRSSPVFINLDDTRITAPLLEGLKSSDV